MLLDDDQLAHFERDGFLILPGWFTPAEVEALRARLPRLFAEDTPANIRERGGREVRTAMGLHQRDELHARLSRHPRFVEPAMQLRGESLYIQQTKVNVKAAYEGEQWQWHYDFATHHAEDGVPEPLALNLHVFLDDVNDFNGPLWFIPGSQRGAPAPAWLDTESTSYPLWIVEREATTKLIESARADGGAGIVAATGPAGTALIFGDALVHGSPPNLSPWDRRIFSLILNPVANAYTRQQRPEWKHHRDLTPVTPLGDDCLLAGSATSAA